MLVVNRSYQELTRLQPVELTDSSVPVDVNVNLNYCPLTPANSREQSSPTPANSQQGMKRILYATTLFLLLSSLLVSCARMGRPDGGWYDETPPSVVGASPEDGGTNVTARKISIFFDEYIKVDNPNEKVIISPPQLEQPEIKAAGKKIEVQLNDTLVANTTYTIDFSDAITDNNENNPMGNYTFSFSTGDAIDTLQVAGYVLEAEDLEPVKGILVGLYNNIEDSVFQTRPMLRVSRTDSRGHFVIKGVAPGSYRIYALQDVDGDYRFSQKSEMIGYTRTLISPTWKADVRRDTLWRDSLHIDDIRQVGYTHFLPDDIVLRAFTEEQTERYLIKTERQQANRFTLFFSYGNEQLPELRGLNFDSRDAFLLEASEHLDTLRYWLRDTALVNQDTLDIEMRYLMTDTLGNLVQQVDTQRILSRQPYAKRLKQQQRDLEQWQKNQERQKKRGLAYETERKAQPYNVEVKVNTMIDPDQSVTFEMPEPMAHIDTTKIHLYYLSRRDSLWHKEPFTLSKASTGTGIDGSSAQEGLSEGLEGGSRAVMRYRLTADWEPETEYSLELDSAFMTNIYGLSTDKAKRGFKVKSLGDYATISMTLGGMQGEHIVGQLLDQQDKPVKQCITDNGKLTFYYVAPGTYYVRVIVDKNSNGRWDTGEYALDRQADEVYYYPQAIECRAKWDFSETWNPKAKPLYQQKPSAITRQKADKEKKVQQRNADRARKLGIPYEPDKIKL